MDGNYEVKSGSKTAGKVQVSRQGLYYRFICRCIPDGEVVSRLVARCGNTCVNIGVLVPVGDVFFLDKKLPVKMFGTEEPVFYLAPRHDRVAGRFVPIYPEEPFAYIERLKDSFLASRNGQPGIMLNEKIPVDHDLL